MLDPYTAKDDGKPLEPVDDEGGPQSKVSSMVQNVPDKDGNTNAPDYEPLRLATSTPTPTPPTPALSTPPSQSPTASGAQSTGTTPASDRSEAAAASD